MSTNTIEPKKAAPGAIWRWIKQATALVVRKPIAFGVTIIALVAADLAFGEFADGPIPAAVFLAVSFPFTAVMCSIAHAADVGEPVGVDTLRVPREVFIGGARWAVILGALIVVVDACLQSDGPPALEYFSGFIADSMIFMTVSWFGMAFCLMLGYGLSWDAAHELRRKGSDRNGLLWLRMWLAFLAAGIPFVIFQPAMPVFCVISAVVQYVGYREIFEHKGHNATERATEPEASQKYALA